jgi:hypothetical protein
MDIFFQDPSDIPLPPEEIRIRELRAEPLPDQRRVRLFIEITPFQKKPNLDIKILTTPGEEAASLSIIEAIDRKMEFTVHIKRVSPSGEYIASLEVYYFEGEFSTIDPESGKEGEIHQLPDRGKPVDHRQVVFKISADKNAG